MENKEDNFAGGHLVMDLLVKNKSSINNEQMVKNYLDQITDLIGLTAITPPYVFKFPFSNEKKRLIQKIEKFYNNMPFWFKSMLERNNDFKVLLKEIEFAKKLETEDCGVSGTVIYAESHSACHGWDEIKINGSDGGITIDVFSCNSLDYEKVMDFTYKYFDGLRMDSTYLDRYFGKPQKIEQFSFGDIS